jgi:Major capsid protein N-terminus
MSAGLVQLVAKGPQDTFLTGNPQISFFRQNHKRYTPFSSTLIRQTIEGTPAPGSISTIRIDKKSDLMGYSYFVATGSDGSIIQNIDWTGTIDKVELLIGDQVIDEQDSIWSTIIEPVTGSNVPSQSVLPAANSFYPLKFFFCKNWSSALPLVSLKFSEVTIRITWSKSFINLGYQYILWYNGIFLDQAEREYYAKNQHILLITQTQRQAVPFSGQYMDLTFSNQVKYIAFQSSTVNKTGLQMKIQINGVDTCDFKNLVQWTDVNQYYYTPTGYAAKPPSVALIPFCLNTALHQPTGTLNFSTLDIFRIVVPQNQIVKSLVTGSYIYAVNYNFLKIEKGVASLIYLS